MNIYTSRVVWCVCLVVLVNTDWCSAVDCVNIERRPGVVYAEESGCVLLNCSADVGPVAWYKNNIPIPNSISRQTFTPEGDLRFDSVSASQAGWYSCVGPTALHQHFLLIVGSSPTSVETVSISYNVVSGSRVELGCVSTGSPPPVITWRDGSDDPVLESNSLRVDPRSNSLIIQNYTRTESGGYYCQLSNDFGVVNATRTVVSITDTPALPYTSPLEDRPTPHNLPTNITTPLTLSCTGLNLQSNNITVQWFKDYTLLSSQTDDNLTLSSVPPQSSDAGYYCCTVSYLDQQINHHCITVWVRESLKFSSILPPTLLALSSTHPRPLLPCAGVERTYDTPLVSWQRDGRPLTNSTHGLNYIRVEGDGVYTCHISNSVKSKSMSFTVSLVDVCSGGVDVVVDGDASNGSMWTPSNNNARVDTINNEQVFVLDYSINGTNFSQSLPQLQVTSLQISARVRVQQTTSNPSSRGLATVRLLTSQGLLTLTNPDNVSQAWQWVGKAIDFPQPIDLLSLQLFVDGGDSGMAYFDNVCVTVTVGPPLLVIIGASVGGGLALLLCLVLSCFCFLCCFLSRNKKQTIRMKKGSVNLKRENGGDVRLEGCTAETETADIHYETLRRDPDYANNDSYQYIDPQEISVSHNSDGQYKALDPKSLETHVYMTATPLSHRSTASIHTLTEEEAASGYLQVLPSSLPNDDDIYENERIVRCATSPTQLEHETNLYECV